MGGFLALAKVGSPEPSRQRATVLRIVGLAAAALGAAAVATQVPLWRGSERTLLAVMSAWVIAEACSGLPGAAGRVLSSRPLLYLGKISYGVYLFHEFVRQGYEALHRLCVASDVRVPGIGVLLVPHTANGAMFPLYFVLVVGLASFSWFLVEKPINELRQKLAYTR
jgi:peptidoglycan/LPS O-acetylase OafA/YrhL